VAKVYFTAQSRRLFDNIREERIKDKITQSLQKLAQNPYTGKKLKGKLQGTYSLRIWPYRILYEITKTKNIILTDIGYRKEIYK